MRKGEIDATESRALTHVLPKKRITASARQNVAQRPLDAVDFFSYHPDGLLIRGNGKRLDRVNRVADLVVPVPNQIDPRRGLGLIAVGISHQLDGEPRKAYSEQGLDGQAVGGAIELQKCEPVNGLARAESGEDDSDTDGHEIYAVREAKPNR